MLKVSLSWQFHLVRTYLTNISTRCSSLPHLSWRGLEHLVEILVRYVLIKWSCQGRELSSFHVHKSNWETSTIQSLLVYWDVERGILHRVVERRGKHQLLRLQDFAKMATDLPVLQFERSTRQSSFMWNDESSLSLTTWLGCSSHPQEWIHPWGRLEYLVETSEG